MASVSGDTIGPGEESSVPTAADVNGLLGLPGVAVQKRCPETLPPTPGALLHATSLRHSSLSLLIGWEQSDPFCALRLSPPEGHEYVLFPVSF